MMKEFRNELLKRKEVKFLIEDSKNPGYAFVSKHVADKMKVDENRIAVKSLRGKFGEKKFVAEAFVYDSEEDKRKIEPKKKEKKGVQNG